MIFGLHLRISIINFATRCQYRWFRWKLTESLIVILRCSTFAPFIASINTINQFIIGSETSTYLSTASTNFQVVILVLRTYALYQRRIAILLVVGIAAIVSVGLGAVSVFIDLVSMLVFPY